MTVPTWLLTLLNFSAAGFALLGAIYWHKASQVKLPPIDQATKLPNGPIDMASINAALVEGGYANKIAARLTAVSATLAGIYILLSPIKG